MDPSDKPETEASAVRPAGVVQEFPDELPTTLSAEKTALPSLVHHRGAVDHHLPLEELERVFREKRVDYLALVQNGGVTGLCARVKLGALLGSRYGFALYGRSPAHLAGVKSPLIFPISTPVRTLLDRSLARCADDFHEDVVLVDGESRLVGLVPVEALAHLQTRLVGEQVAEMQRQHETLRRQNLDLFQANHAQRQAEGLYQGLFESNTLGVALLDVHGNVQAHNRRLAELLNLGEGSFAIPSLNGWMGEWDRLRFTHLLASREREEPGSNARGDSHEFILTLPTRGPRLFRFTTGWIRETGQICACVDDITEQRALERNMARQEKQRLLDTLVGGIAHELNNKLTPVIGFSEMLRNQVGVELRDQAAVISQSAQEASRIIRQLLQLSKPESGNPRRIDLRSVVEEALLMLKFQIRERGCALRTSLAASPVVILADPAQIKQIVINLVLNALEAMEGMAEPAITISVAEERAGALLTVADRGPGIAPEHLGRIFDPFFTTKGPDRGSGLGLSICFSIAREYGGDISVASEVGAGATFTVSFPVALGAIEAAPAGMASADGRTPAVLGLKVLVVEDEEVIRLLLQEMLRSSFGCKVHLASNGAEALSLVERIDFDLVISDIRMPVMAGTELYLRLREIHPELVQRFAFITGHPGEKSLQEEIARWDVPVLAKPFVPGRLIEICKPLLERRYRHGPAGTDPASLSAG